MTIKITRQLTPQQYIKLFSNPISGIACEVDSYNRDHIVKYACRNIRYSKSMLLGALEFWADRLFKVYLKMTRVYNPLEPMKDMGWDIMEKVNKIQEIINYIKTVPKTWLFSHRYIDELSMYKYTDGIKIQLKLVKEKFELGMVVMMQYMTMDPFFKYYGLPFDLSFTVFPNEHPYIKREKIVEVGKTNRGNTFVIKENNVK